MIQVPELTGVMMSNLYWLTDDQMERLEAVLSEEPWQAAGG
jgi:hypothetical protein